MKCIDCKYSHGQPGGLECRGGTPIGDERFPLVRDDQCCRVFEVAELNVVSMEPMNIVSPVSLSTRDDPPAPKKPHAKPPRRKGKHGQKTSSQES